MTDNGLRTLRFSRGRLMEDPRGLDVIWNACGRKYLARVYDVEYREFGCAGIYLKVRHFNGEDAPDVSAFAVKALDRNWEREVKQS